MTMMMMMKKIMIPTLGEVKKNLPTLGVRKMDEVLAKTHRLVVIILVLHQLEMREAIAIALVVIAEGGATRHTATHCEGLSLIVKNHLRPFPPVADHRRRNGPVRHDHRLGKFDRRVVSTNTRLAPSDTVKGPSVPSLLQLRDAGARKRVDKPVVVEES